MSDKYKDEGGERYGKSVMFMGSTPNIGNTFCALATAVQTAIKTNDDILFLCLNLKSSKLHRYLGVDRPLTTLDQIRASLRSQSLKPEHLTRHSQLVAGIPNLHVLYGNMLRDQAEYFEPEDITYLLDIAKQRFKLCIIDVHAYWDNAATIAALLNTDIKMLVTSNEIGHFQEDIERWVKSMGPLFDITPAQFYLYINQLHPRKLDGFSAKDIGREAGMEVIAEMSYETNLLSCINEGRLAPFLLHHTSLQEQLNTSIKLISPGLDMKQDKKANQHPAWIRRLISI
jgi:hypothetical protein